MLVRTPDELRRTDVPEHVVEALAGHAVREVLVVGRRGPQFAKFTNKELQELAAVEGADVLVSPEELAVPAPEAPAAKRLLATLQKIADREPQGRDRSIRFLFNRTPVEFLGDTAVAAARLTRTTDPTVVEDVDASLILPAVGYRSVALDGVPFSDASGTIPHRDSRVLEGDGTVSGLYVVGWAKRGPSGVIGTNRLCASETVAAILEDAATLLSRDHTAESIDALLDARGVKVVDWSQWQLIEATEAQLGQERGRDRVKLHNRADMLSAAHARLAEIL
jgi:ferredoxin--NADP+ reductase